LDQRKEETVRDLILKMSISIDGFVGGPDGGIRWVFDSDPEAMAWPIIAHGGASFARSLVAAGLVDQYHLLMHPVALGKGLPVFSDLAAPRPLKLMSSKAFPGGSVAQIYRPA
jgi:dihydrofolate reductase